MNGRPYRNLNPRLQGSVYIDRNACVIGDVHLGADSSVWPMAVVRGDMNSIRIGARTNVQDGAVIHVTHRSLERPDGYPVRIGDDVTIGHRATLHGCTIGNECLIGIGAIVLDGVVIQDRVLLGAGSLVAERKTLESGYLYLGCPAQKLRPLTEQELTWFRSSAERYVRLKNDYLGSAERSASTV